MTINKFIKYYSVLLSVLLINATHSFAQLKNMAIGANIGIQTAKMKNFNNELSITNKFYCPPFKFDSTLNFKHVNNFLDVALSLQLDSIFHNNIQILIQSDYLYTPEQMEKILSLTHYNGVNLNNIFDTIWSPYNPDSLVEYDFGVRTSSFIFSIMPFYRIINLNKFSASFGIGPNFYIAALKQHVIAIHTSPTTYELDYSEAISSFKKTLFSYQIGAMLTYQISKKISLTIHSLYKKGKVKSVGETTILYTGNANHENSVLPPISKTDIDFSGMNFSIGINYRFY